MAFGVPKHVKEARHKVFFGATDTEGRTVTHFNKPTYRVGSVEGFVVIPYTDEFQGENIKRVKTIIYFMYTKPKRGDNLRLVNVTYHIYAKFYDKFILVQPKEGLVSINPQYRAFLDSDLFSAAKDAAERSLGAKLLGR